MCIYNTMNMNISRRKEFEIWNGDRLRKCLQLQHRIFNFAC